MDSSLSRGRGEREPHDNGGGSLEHDFQNQSETEIAKLDEAEKIKAIFKLQELDKDGRKEPSGNRPVIQTNHDGFVIRPSGSTDSDITEISNTSRSRRLGNGGGGTVYCTKGALDHQTVAIKKMKIRSNDEKEFSEDCREAQREAQLHALASSRNHPHIVAYKDAMTAFPTDDSKQSGSGESNSDELPGESKQSGSEESNSGADYSKKAGSEESELGELAELFEVQLLGHNKNHYDAIFSGVNDADKDASGYSTAEEESTSVLSKDYCFKLDFMIVMEYCRNGNLEKFLIDSGKKLSTGDRLILFSNIINAVHFLHEKMGILHRDIKPMNIFLTHDSEDVLVAKLGDFGLSCKIEDVPLKLGVGTEFFSSPEQLCGKLHGKPTDVYSLGIILLALTLNSSNTHQLTKHVTEMKTSAKPSLLWEAEVEPSEEHNELYHLIKGMTKVQANERPKIEDVKKQVLGLVERLALKQKTSTGL